jgi:hypothetical protein
VAEPGHTLHLFIDFVIFATISTSATSRAYGIGTMFTKTTVNAVGSFRPDKVLLPSAGCSWQVQLRRDVDRPMKRPVHGTLRLEHFVRPYRRLYFLRDDILQCEHHVNAPKHQHAVFDFYFAACHRCQLLAARCNPARFQRATQCSEQSTTGRGHEIIERRGVGIGHLTLNAIVPSDWTMRTEAYWLGFSRQVRQTQSTPNPRQSNLWSIDNLAHPASLP